MKWSAIVGRGLCLYDKLHNESLGLDRFKYLLNRGMGQPLYNTIFSVDRQACTIYFAFFLWTNFVRKCFTVVLRSHHVVLFVKNNARKSFSIRVTMCPRNKNNFFSIQLMSVLSLSTTRIRKRSTQTYSRKIQIFG